MHNRRYNSCAKAVGAKECPGGSAFSKREDITRNSEYTAAMTRPAFAASGWLQSRRNCVTGISPVGFGFGLRWSSSKRDDT